MRRRWKDTCDTGGGEREGSVRPSLWIMAWPVGEGEETDGGRGQQRSCTSYSVATRIGHQLRTPVTPALAHHSLEAEKIPTILQMRKRLRRIV